MLLSKPQKELLDILRQFGALREDQAKKLLLQRYPSLHFDPVVHQTVCGGLIRKADGYIYAQGKNYDSDTEAAMDVMLLLEPKHIDTMQKGITPFTLTFFKERQGKLWRYDVCVVTPGRETLLCAALENINHKYRMIVFVLNSLEQQKKLAVPCEHCFAWKKNGTYKFYK